MTIVADLKNAYRKAKDGYVAVPRTGWPGRVFGPEYRPLEEPTKSTVMAVEQNSETTTTIKKAAIDYSRFPKP
jgi:hypothetical protein